jgi:hypothetical protein
VADSWQSRDGGHYYAPGHWDKHAKVKKEKHGDNGKGQGKGRNRD